VHPSPKFGPSLSARWIRWNVSPATPERRRNPMDYGWMSHALLWFVGALSAATAVCVVGAFLSLGRSYKD